MTLVYEHDVVDYKVHVALHVVGNDSIFSMMQFNSWQYKVSVLFWKQYSNYTENT